MCMCVRVLTQKSMHARGKSPERKKRFGILIKVRYISFIGIRTLFDQITRGYGDHSPLTRPKEEVTHGGRCRRGRGCRRLGEETGNPIMAFHRPSFFPSFERAPHHTTTENPLAGRWSFALTLSLALPNPLSPLLVSRRRFPKLFRGGSRYPPSGIKQADIVKQRQRTRW